MLPKKTNPTLFFTCFVIYAKHIGNKLKNYVIYTKDSAKKKNYTQKTKLQPNILVLAYLCLP